MDSIIVSAYRDDKLVRNIELVEFDKAIMDIIYFYHEQSKWGTMSGDMNFGISLSLPYWDYLDLRGDRIQDEIDFIRHGSLLILLSMSLEFYEDLGNFFLSDNEKAKLVKDSLSAFSPQSKSETEIRDLALLLLDKIGRLEFRYDQSVSQRINDIFIYNIYGFFRERINTFDKTAEKLYKKLDKKNAR